MRPTAAPSLEPGRLSPCCCYWRWIQRLQRWVSGTLQASPGLPQTPPAARHTGHLQTPDILVRKLSHMHWFSLIPTHILSVSNSPWLTFQKSNEENPAQHKLHGEVSVLCWSQNGNTWDSRGWGSSPSCRRQRAYRGLQRGHYLHVLWHIYQDSDLDLIL